MHERANIVLCQFLPSPEEIEFDEKRDSHNNASLPLDKAACGQRRPARGKEVVMNKHTFSCTDGIDMHLDGVGSVFK